MPTIRTIKSNIKFIVRRFPYAFASGVVAGFVAGLIAGSL